MHGKTPLAERRLSLVVAQLPPAGSAEEEDEEQDDQDDQDHPSPDVDPGSEYERVHVEPSQSKC
jgi:hypothetical protein